MSYLDRILDHVSRSRRKPKVRQVLPEPRYQAPVKRRDPPQRIPQLSPSHVLERINGARRARERAEAELATLVDHAVDLGVGWPEIAAQLGVTRQAARQQYQRRHRGKVGHQDRVA